MSTQSLLLRLPGELRNRIYGFALSSSTPLCYRSSAHGSIDAKKRDFPSAEKAIVFQGRFDIEVFEFNLLKYVNKQLYSETAGLELKFNDIELTRNYIFQDPPGAQFVRWVSTMTPVRQSWLHGATVTLSDNSFRNDHLTNSDTAPIIAEIAQFCKAHPSLQIKYIVSGWYFARGFSGNPILYWEDFFRCIFQNGLLYNLAFRMDRFDSELEPLSTSIAPMILDGIRQLASRWRRDVQLADLQADNLRFFPDPPGNLKLMRNRALKHAHGSVLRRVELALRWADEGF